MAELKKPLTKEQAEALKTKGFLSDETVNKMYEPQIEAPAQAAPLGLAQPMQTKEEPKDEGGFFGSLGRAFLTAGPGDSFAAGSSKKPEAGDEIFANMMKNAAADKESARLKEEADRAAKIGVDLQARKAGFEQAVNEDFRNGADINLVKQKYGKYLAEIQELEREYNSLVKTKNPFLKTSLASGPVEEDVYANPTELATQGPAATATYSETPVPMAAQPAVAAPAPVDALSQTILSAVNEGKADAVRQAAFLEQQADEQVRTAAANETKMMQEMDQIETKLKELDVAIQNHAQKSISRQEVTDKFWADKTTGEKVLAGIALLLGASGGVVGKGNTAAAAINKAIDQDILLQEKALERQGAALKERRGVYADMLDLTKDRFLARNATRAAALEAVSLRIKGFAAKHDNRELQMNAAKALASIAGEQAKIRAENAKYQGARIAMGDPRLVDPNTLDAKQKALYIPGHGFAPTPEEGKKGREALEAKTEIENNINEMINLREKHGTEFFNRAAVSDGKRYATNVMLTMKKLAELGVLNGPDLVLMEKMVPSDPLSTSWTVKSDLANLKKIIQSKFDAKLKSMGIQTLDTRLGLSAAVR